MPNQLIFNLYSTYTALRLWRAATRCCWWKSGSTCSPVFTLLRDDVTQSPTPHVALPGNMKGGEQEDLQRPREQTSAHTGLKNGPNHRWRAPWRKPTKVNYLLRDSPTFIGKVFLFFVFNYSFGQHKVNKLANVVRWGRILSDLREHMLGKKWSITTISAQRRATNITDA